MARRRAGRFLSVAALVLLIALPLALKWPAVYRSTATILIEEQEIPRDLVRSTMTSFADERIQVIRQQVMTRATLLQIVEKYDLYPRERRYLANEEILERMRRDIQVETISADSGGRGGARAQTTIAFKLSYDDETPDKAQKVANELVTLYLNENLRTRRQRAEETRAFFAGEAERIGRQIAEIEAKLAAFKRTYAGRLPELMALNMQLRDRAEAALDDQARQLRLLEDRRAYLETQLTVVRETAPVASERALEPEERLKLQRNQYTSLSGVYAYAHPDLVRLRREIEALEKSTGAKPAPDPEKLKEAKTELARLTERYSGDHPDVLRQKRAVSALEADYEQATQGGRVPRKPDNPAYVALAAQIESVKSEAESLRNQRAELLARAAGYRERLEQTPGIEQAYLDLTRDHENATLKYKEIRAKQMEADVARELENDRKGERFSLIDPPQFPERPQRPNRPLLMSFALLASLGGGAGAAGLAEAFDRSVKSARSLAALLEAPLLGVLPRAENEAQRARRRRVLLIGAAASVLLLLAAALAVHFFVIPLDSLWYVLMRRLQF